MKNLHAVLTDAERERVAFLNLNLERKRADAFMAGEYLKLEGSQRLGNGRSLKSGVYCVIHWRPDRLEVMPYGQRTKIDVPFVWKAANSEHTVDVAHIVEGGRVGFEAGAGDGATALAGRHGGQAVAFCLTEGQ